MKMREYDTFKNAGVLYSGGGGRGVTNEWGRACIPKAICVNNLGRAYILFWAGGLWG